MTRRWSPAAAAAATPAPRRSARGCGAASAARRRSSGGRCPSQARSRSAAAATPSRSRRWSRTPATWPCPARRWCSRRTPAPSPPPRRRPTPPAWRRVTFSAGANRSESHGDDHGQFGQRRAARRRRHRRHRAGLSGHDRALAASSRCRSRRSDSTGERHRELPGHRGEQPRQRPVDDVADDRLAGHRHRRLHRHECRHRHLPSRRRHSRGGDPDQRVPVRVRVCRRQRNIPVGTTADRHRRLRRRNVLQAGQDINFATTAGIVDAASAMTDGAGQATVAISAPSAGPAVIQATVRLLGRRLRCRSSSWPLRRPGSSCRCRRRRSGRTRPARRRNRPSCAPPSPMRTANPVGERDRHLHPHVLDPSGGDAVSGFGGHRQQRPGYRPVHRRCGDHGQQRRPATCERPRLRLRRCSATAIDDGDAERPVHRPGHGQRRSRTSTRRPTRRTGWSTSPIRTASPCRTSDLTIKVLPSTIAKAASCSSTAAGSTTSSTEFFHLPERGSRTTTASSIRREDFNGNGILEPGNVILLTTAQTPTAAATGIARTDRRPGDDHPALRRKLRAVGSRSG